MPSIRASINLTFYFDLPKSVVRSLIKQGASESACLNLSIEPEGDDSNPGATLKILVEDLTRNPSGEIPLLSQPAPVLPELAAEKLLLSPREWEVLRLLAQGASNSDICRTLTISHNTGKAHVQRVMRKLNCTNRTQVALLGERLLQHTRPEGHAPQGRLMA